MEELTVVHQGLLRTEVEPAHAESNIGCYLKAKSQQTNNFHNFKETRSSNFNNRKED